jgi:CO/xanthine dehydrogenase FAD-binding subunit
MTDKNPLLRIEDLHASVAYRRDLVRVMTRRALERALAS